MEYLKHALNWIFNIITYIALAIQAYYLFLSFFGFYTKKRKMLENGQRTFAVVVAAHNEEVVIKETIEAIKKQNYPRKLFDIYVIADNCTDNTAKVSKETGVNVVEREDNSKAGKGYALQYFFNKLLSLEKKYRSVVIVDADNILHQDFLLEMNKKMNQGYKVVQGFLDSKNPFDSVISSSYSIEFWTTNRMLKLSRDNLGLSAQLGGTGFAVDTDILEKFGWDATCLTEDLEFTCKLVLNDYKVGWCHKAKIFDESPIKLKQSLKQRKRWMQGYADVYSNYFVKLVKKGFKKPSLIALDCALCVLQPILFIIFGLNILIMAYRSIINLPQVINNYLTLNFLTNFDWSDILLGVIILYQTLYMPIQLYLDNKLSLKTLIAFLIYPIYAITWIPVAILGIINKDNKEWSHTKHTRVISLEEINK